MCPLSLYLARPVIFFLLRKTGGVDLRKREMWRGIGKSGERGNCSWNATYKRRIKKKKENTTYPNLWYILKKSCKMKVYTL